MVDPAVSGSKATFEQHHLFPRGYLAKSGVTDVRTVNQIANYAIVEWPENVKISDQAPGEYAPAMEATIPPHEREMVRAAASSSNRLSGLIFTQASRTK
jgi:hypothetical protein